MQNVAQESSSDNQKLGKVNVHHDIGKSSTPISSNSSHTKSETETYSELQPRFMSDSSESEEDDVSEVESFEINPDLDEEARIAPSKFLLSPDTEEPDSTVDPETQARLEALLEAAGIGKLSTGDGKHLADPEVLRRLTSSVSCALDEAAAALTRMRSENPRPQVETRSLVEACSDGDVGTVRKLLTEGRSVHETTEEGESLLSLACSAGYYELAQVLLAMHANVEDRGIKGDCTPLMEAASAGHVDIVRLLIAHSADVNAQSSSGNTPLMYACAGGHEEVVRILLGASANVEDHNENGHTPLMEAASAGHVGVAKILLDNGAGINTHSNEFKESALTLACYKGHLDMVRFLLDRGADQEHKTDEMHTALMEASMDGHVEVARLLLDSGAQVNMPTDSFESPLTLAACGGHVDLAMLLIERGANIEEVNDEGYTPLMEAAREGHEEMVALLLSQGANINAQTEETQETALTLACCGGFTDVADFLIKAGADIELGASTPLMEAAQEGHLELVKYLLEATADVHAQTQTGDTALTYACENGHTDVADLLLQYGADLEHESEGGRTPLMKACRAGHLCTVQFLITKRADVNRQTTNNDHTPLSLACAGGHLGVVELLLAQTADPFHKLKDNSTMLIEAAKGGHTSVVQLLLDYPHSIMMTPPHPLGASQGGGGLDEVPEAVKAAAPLEEGNAGVVLKSIAGQAGRLVEHLAQQKHNTQKSLLRRSRSSTMMAENNLTPAETQQDEADILDKGSTTPIAGATDWRQQCREETIFQKQQILEELQRVERELQEKGPGQLLTSPERPAAEQPPPTTLGTAPPPSTMSTATLLPGVQPLGINIDLAPQGLVCGSGMPGTLFSHGSNNSISVHNSFYTGKGGQQLTLGAPGLGSCLPQPNPPGVGDVSDGFGSGLNPLPPPVSAPTPLPQAPADVVQGTAISDRPKAKPVSKKEGKNLRKQQAYHAALHQQLSQQQGQQNTMQFHQMPSHFAQQQPLEPNLSTPIITPNQLMAQLHQLDPMVTPSTPTQLNQMLQQKSQQLISLQQQIMPQGTSLEPADLAGLLSDQQVQHNQMFSAVAKEALALDKPVKVKMNALERLAMTAEKSAEGRRKQLIESQAVLEEAISVLAASSCPASPDSAKVEYFTVGPEGGQIPVLVPPGSAVCVQYQPYQLTGATNAIQPAAAIAQFPPSGAAIVADAVSPNALQTTQISRDPRLRNLQSAAEAPFAPRLLLHTPQPAFPSQVAPACIEASGNLPPVLPTPVTAAPSQAPTSLCSGHHAQAPCSAHQAHQVQVATQTNLEKKGVGAAVAGGGKGKKARYQLQPRVQPATQPAAPAQTAPGPTYHMDSNGLTTIVPAGTTPAQYGAAAPCPQAPFSCMDVDSETDSNHDTALTLACAGGHEELVELLLSRGADIEHRDKKGFTPLILAATAGHEKVVEILLNHGADIEAQSERTKDTPLSLACSGGRYEVVELLLTRGSNKEHRNVSDYTPLSLAASGGYVNIIKLLLAHGAEINSRTGSKLGISPLMLAAMNGHTAAVKLLLDMGSDINAQIETNRNTALTLACFQGRHEVVSLLLDRKANVEHRAKTGLTPLMEAASGGYVEVGRVLLDKGADVNAPPVPSSRDTALTIAADKGHCRFVELLLTRGAQVEVKNKKGNSPLWLAANGGHLSVVELLYNAHADIDSEDNRKVSCLMAAFRKGHMKVVKWMVNHVTQFPSDQEMTRYIATVSDKELLEKCQDCVKIIRAAKDQQAAKANKNASILLEELDMEKNREDSKKAAAARRRERKKKKKLEKKEEKKKLFEENQKNELYDDDDDDDEAKSDDDGDDGEEIEVAEARSIENTPEADSPARNAQVVDKEEGDSGIDANSQGSCSSNDVKSKEKRKDKKKKKALVVVRPGSSKESSPPIVEPEPIPARVPPSTLAKTVEFLPPPEVKETRRELIVANNQILMLVEGNPSSKQSNRALNHERKMKGHMVFESSRPHPAEREDFEATGNETYVPASKGKKNSSSYMNHYCDADLTNSGNTSNNKSLLNSTSPKQGGKREEGWKEVVRKYLNSPFKSKKVSVPLNAISRVIGRGGSNINAIRGATGAHIEVEKQSKGQGERIITIKGSAEATRQAHTLIAALIKDPEVDILQMLPKSAKVSLVSVSAWDKTTVVSKAKTLTSKATASVVSAQPASLLGAGPTALMAKPVAGVVGAPIPLLPSLCPPPVTKLGGPPPVTRGTAPRLVAAAEKRAAAAQLAVNTKTTMSYTSAIMTYGRPVKIESSIAPSTFATKLTETSAAFHLPPATSVTKSRVTQQPITSLVSTTVSSPKHHRPMPPASAPPSIPGQYQLKAPFSMPVSQSAPTSSAPLPPAQTVAPAVVTRSTTPLLTKQEHHQAPPRPPANTPQEYSLFNDSYSKVQQPMWGRENDNPMQKGMNFASVAATGAITGATNGGNTGKYMDDIPLQVDASKAPGYRGNAMCSPVSSKSSTTPPSHPPYQNSVTYSSEQPISSGSVMALAAKQQAVAHRQAELQQSLDAAAYNSRGILSNHQQHNIMVSSAQDHSGMYPSDHGQLLKLVPDQQSQQHIPFQHHHHQQQQQQQQQHHHQNPMNFSQTQSNPQSNTNTTVSMSRLNPRAPDFSLHVPNKPQQTNMFNNPAPPFHQRSGVLPPPQNPNLMTFPLGKSNLGQYHPQNTPASNMMANGQRWPMFSQHPFHQSHHPEMAGQMNYPNSIAHMSAIGSNLNHSGNMTGSDLLASLENGGMAGGNSPAMSPNNVPNEVHHHKMEDRKIMPIGTERASWKTFGNVGVGACGDLDGTAWMLGGGANEVPKMPLNSWAGGNMGPTVERHQLDRCNRMYRPNHNQFGRIPPPDDLSHMIDATFQQSGHPDNLNSFHSGTTAAAMSLMQHGLQMMPQSHYHPAGPDMGPPDNSGKMEPNWDAPPPQRTINTLPDGQDKQHGWAAKWSH